MGIVLCDAMCTVQTIGGGRLSAGDLSDDQKASVLHVVGLTVPPEAYFPESDAIAVRLSPMVLSSWLPLFMRPTKGMSTAVPYHLAQAGMRIASFIWLPAHTISSTPAIRG
jgi:hypothetical protein